MGLWRDEVAVLFVRQVTAQALPYVKPALKRPACCIIVITVTKSQAAQIKPITAHHANQLYQHGTLALLVPGLLEGTTTIGELLTHGDTGIGTGEGLDGELIILDGVAYKVGQSGVAERVPDDFTMPFANVHHAAFQYQCERRDIGLEDLNNRIVEANGRANTFFSVIVRGTFSFIKTRAVIKQQAPYPDSGGGRRPAGDVPAARREGHDAGIFLAGDVSWSRRRRFSRAFSVRRSHVRRSRARRGARSRQDIQSGVRHAGAASAGG